MKSQAGSSGTPHAAQWPAVAGAARAVSDELVPRRLTPPSFLPSILASLLPSERPSETWQVDGRRRLQAEIAQPFCLLFTASDRDAMNSELSAIFSTVKFLILIDACAR